MSAAEAAIAAGATVLGDPGTVQHYLLTAEQLAECVRLLTGEVGQKVLPPPY